jgi:hypothetical protein
MIMFVAVHINFNNSVLVLDYDVLLLLTINCFSCYIQSIFMQRKKDLRINKFSIILTMREVSVKLQEKEEKKRIKIFNDSLQT